MIPQFNDKAGQAMRTPRSLRIPSLITQCAAPLALLALTALPATPSAQAQTYVYSGTTSNTAGTAYQWTDPLDPDWTTGGNPVSDPLADVWFSDATLPAGATIFSNNDNAGVFQLNTLNFNYGSPASGTAPQVTLSGNAIEVTDRVNFFAVGGPVFPVYTVSNDLQTTAGGNALIFVAPPLSATVSGNLTGGGFTKAGEGDLTLSGTASSVVRIVNVGGGTLNLTGNIVTTERFSTIGFGGTLTATTNSSGSITTPWLLVGDGENGILNVTAGTVTNTGDVVLGTGATGIANVSGGTMTVAAGKALYIGAGWNGSSDGTGVLTVSGSGTVSTGALFAFRLGPDGTATGTGTVNLDGGTLSTPSSIVKGASAGATAIFNFNGGTLQAGGDNAAFMTGLTSANVKAGGAVIDTQGFAVTIDQALLAASAGGGLTKLGAGALVLGGVNTYTGNTVVSSGMLTLSDNAGLKFVIGANGVNNGVSGTGTVNLDGDFTFDLSGAAAVGSWTIVDTGTLTETFGATFTVVGFTDNLDNTWTSGNYTFSETSGLLTAVPEPSTLAMLAGGIGMLAGLQRRRRA